MISTSDIFDAAKRNDEVYTLQYLGDGLYMLLMEDDRNNGLLAQKMNSYGVLKVIDPTWYGIQFAPRNLTKEFEDSVEAADVQYDEADFEDFANNWEEVESDDGHRDLYKDLK
jgi:hypothetical protein|tara:strand:- start:119 stop:457 length:339 start_codon:yes stop_codon:yes gene_type:complete